MWFDIMTLSKLRWEEIQREAERRNKRAIYHDFDSVPAYYVAVAAVRRWLQTGLNRLSPRSGRLAPETNPTAAVVDNPCATC
ncbi:MAG: hypothetical protein M1546_24985 [Chloroflexi bacterium]|nr:hypothetical protein [Chloroflexota bacterium]